MSLATNPAANDRRSEFGVWTDRSLIRSDERQRQRDCGGSHERVFEETAACGVFHVDWMDD
jgi:hypothetical protein